MHCKLLATTQNHHILSFFDRYIMATKDGLPVFILFGASMVEWSFREQTEGLGWFLSKTYEGKTHVLNEGSIHIHPYLSISYNFQ